MTNDLTETTTATITATASGSQTPPKATRPETVINGDFEISDNNELAPVVGDGLDERTFWSFDFTQDPQVLAFQQAESLTEATLTLELRVIGGADTDVIAIEGLPKYVDSPVIKDLTSNEAKQITINLLDTYTSEEILGALQEGEFGKFGMYYDDDAIVSQASLELSGDIATNNIVGSPEVEFLFDVSDDTTFFGLEGDDRIKAGGGNDSIEAGDGQDVVDAEAGDDFINSGNGNDILLAGEGNDSVLGGEGNDWLSGGIGNDTMNGEDGIDFLEGGVGNEYLIGGDGTEYIFSGEGDDIVNGGSERDFLQGNAGNDIIFGGEGVDNIQGDAGDDILNGGLGADRFIFQSLNVGLDIIEDYSVEEGDFILIGKNFGASSTDQFSYNPLTGGVSFDASATDDIEAKTIAILGNQPADFSTDMIQIAS